MQLRPGEPEEVGMSARRVRHVGQLAAGWVAQGITSALVILVARRGVVVLHEAFGRLTPDDNAPPVKRDTIYPLASLTKPITATAAMLLVEDGLLGLQRPVSEYLPEFSGEGKHAVMVHHCGSHPAWRCPTAALATICWGKSCGGSVDKRWQILPAKGSLSHCACRILSTSCRMPCGPGSSDAPWMCHLLPLLPRERLGSQPEKIRSCLWAVAVSIRPPWPWRYSARCSSIAGATGRREFSA